MAQITNFKAKIFRYRSVDSLLGNFQELKNKSIYFSPPENLNDPMEGFRQIYWDGDKVSWRNLLRHYIICLQNLCIDYIIAGETTVLDPNEISVFLNLQKFPTEQSKKLCEECIVAIEGNPIFTALLEYLANSSRNIDFAELSRLLSLVHIDCIIEIERVFYLNKLISKPQEPIKTSTQQSPLIDIFQSREEIYNQIQEKDGKIAIDILNEIDLLFMEELKLLSLFNNYENLPPNRTNILLNFTTNYLKNLNKIIYPPWYVSCFSQRCDNTAMWSYYAGNHNGCCLIFNTQEKEGDLSIRLNGVCGSGSNGPIRATRDHQLKPVKYTNDDQHLEFFSNIGNLSHNDLMGNWFTDDSGELSKHAKNLSDTNSDSWQSRYWNDFSPPLMRKLPDWEHEQEYRIILSDRLGLRTSDEGRIFTYDYDTLDGIIFGINMSISDKVHVMQIAARNLKERTIDRPFKFYQAHYQRRTGKLEIVSLDTLKFQ